MGLFEIQTPNRVILNQVPQRNSEIQSAGRVVISAWHSITDVFVTGPILHKTTLTDSSKCSSSDILLTASSVVSSNSGNELIGLQSSLSACTYI